MLVGEALFPERLETDLDGAVSSFPTTRDLCACCVATQNFTNEDGSESNTTTPSAKELFNKRKNILGALEVTNLMLVPDISQAYAHCMDVV